MVLVLEERLVWRMGHPLASLLSVVLCIPLAIAGSHKTFVLTSSTPAGEHNLGPVDGATVMSDEYYNIRNCTRSVYLQPSEPAARLLVQFVYIDLPQRVGRQTYCQESLSICEAGEDTKSLHCDIGIVSDFCGSLKDLFVGNPFISRLHYVATRHPGRALNIKWKVVKKSSRYRGFQLIVTSFLAESTDCGHDSRYWQCKDGKCIDKGLHCDGIPHCPDGTDEMVNCTTSGWRHCSDFQNGSRSQRSLLIPVGHGCQIWQGGVCNGKTWKERWFGLAIPMVIVMVLLLIAIFVRIRKQLRQPPPVIATARLRHLRQRRRNMTHHLASGLVGSRACTLAPTVGQLVQQNPVVNPNILEQASVMLLPPPYSPPECLPYEPPYNGEPPPEYEAENDLAKLTNCSGNNASQT